MEDLDDHSLVLAEINTTQLSDMASLVLPHEARRDTDQQQADDCQPERVLELAPKVASRHLLLLQEALFVGEVGVELGIDLIGKSSMAEHNQHRDEGKNDSSGEWDHVRALPQVDNRSSSGTAHTI